MELKVWCEGLPRVLCGVTESTTCHDVVVALAQAMGRPGRYKLLEKWRESERALSPDEHLVEALHKWGEYAGDVQFILQTSRSSGRPGSADTRSKSAQSDLRTRESRPRKQSFESFSPRLSVSRSSSTSSLRKSLTFSGAHSRGSSSSILVPKSSAVSSEHGPAQEADDESSLDSLTEHSSLESSRLAHGTSTHSSLELRGRRSKLQDSLSSQSSASSLDQRNSNVPPKRTPPPPPNGSTAALFKHTNGSLDRTRKRNRGDTPSRQSTAPSPLPSSRVSSSSSSSSSSSPLSSSSLSQTVSPPTSSRPSSRSTPSLPNSQPTNGHIQLPPPSRYKPAPPSPDTLPNQALTPRESNNNNVDFKPNANLSKLADGSTLGQPKVQSDKDTEDKRTDAIRVVNLQLEKLHRQEHEMSDIDAEIVLKESAMKGWTREDASTSEELSRLEKREAELDGEIQDLELVSWQDKLEMERDKERRIQAEIQTLRQKIQNCENEVQRQEELIKKLSLDSDKEQEEQRKNKQKERDEEVKVRHEISDLQRQIGQRRLVQETQQSSIDNVQTEVRDIERQIQDKSVEIESLEREVKDSNLERFSRAPGNWLRASQEGVTSFTRPSSTRPGSGRRLESPQRLKETAVSAKNPLGLWV